MDRREFMTAGLTAGTLALGGGALWAKAAYGRSQLTKSLIAEAMPEIAITAYDELRDLPKKGCDLIRTWFHGPCLNSAEFVYEVCSNAFAERLAACSTEGHKELCFLNVFISKVTSETEIHGRLEIIAEELGGELNRNWIDCCKRISTKWGLHIKPFGSSVPDDFPARLEPQIRLAIDEAIQRAGAAGQKPAISHAFDNIGKSALMLLPMADIPGLAIPLFALLALRELLTYIVGQFTRMVAERQRAVSERLAFLGHQIGLEFQRELSSRIADLQSWQEHAVRDAAAEQAKDAISII